MISDESKDRYGTVIKADGWLLDNYERNGIVAYNHYTGGFNPDNIIGKGRAWVENGVLWGEVELEPDNPTADKVLRRLNFGTLRAASVGFNPMAWSEGDPMQGEERGTLYFRKQELLEWSIVDVPANPNAELQRGYGDFVRMAMDEIKKPDVASVVEAVRQADEINAEVSAKINGDVVTIKTTRSNNYAAKDAPAITGPDEFITKLLTVKMYQL
jgi:HK97 family phage prohead protease